MVREVEARRYRRGIAAAITRLGAQVPTAVWQQIRQLERDRSLNALLVVGLVTINLAAFGTAYWWATRDILSEVSGEVLAEWMEAPNGPAARDQATRTRSVKRSSLSTASSSAREPEAELALPLPPPRMTPPSAPKTQTPPRLSVPVIVMDEPLTSPITTPPQEKAIQRPPAVTPTGKRADLESP